MSKGSFEPICGPAHSTDHTAINSIGLKWETWESLCKHKNDGGMGFRDLSVFNLAMLSKLAWKIFSNPECLVARILRAKYFSDGDFLHAQRGYNPSFVWTSIYSGVQVLRRGLRWKICSGNNIQIWGQPWLNNDASFFIQTPQNEDWGLNTVSDLFIQGTKQWDRHLLDQVFNAEDVNNILKTMPSPQGGEDRHIWHYSDRGVFSVKSCYNMGMNVLDGNWDHEVTAWGKFWKLRTPPRIKLFFWRLCKGWLCVKTKIRKWRPDISEDCDLCADGRETMWHLFITCPFATACWNNSGLGSTIAPLLGEVDDLSDLMLRLVTVVERRILERIMVVVWQIWKSRNDKVWNDNVQLPVQAMHGARCFVSEWKLVRDKPPKVQHTICRSWHLPAVGTVKINSDASFLADSRSTGIGMVARSDTGSVLWYKTEHWPGLMEVDEGEAYGVLEAVRWARELRLERVEFEFDSQRVKGALDNGVMNTTVFGDIIHQIKEVSSEFLFCSFKWVFRNANLLADSLSRISYAYESPSVWVEPPIDVDGLLNVCFNCQ